MDADGSLTSARDRCSSKFSWPQTYDRRSASCLLSNMDANGNGDHVEFDEDGNGFITAAELAGSMVKWETYRELYQI
ncbi:hypothetical protein OIU76_013700 [Salix suchowensis]|uniref:EF-hand domain-containing protein n=1 Tax=Salix suchowensis TaxID=1278906 RepID=A0ABQ9A2H3_9ROSI|nr:hypothetical protein OIU76_013700 [Salix suchowensis]KAJ6322156.1 hypothetical protein OIU77_012101 [Salix suchowensis]